MNNIYLIGPMGAGKSTIGSLLAEQLKAPFEDVDKVIVDHAGADIPWIFDVEGESGFRLRETQALEELTAKDNLVLATGGGAILAKENRQMLSTHGFVVYLHASVEQQLIRTAKDKNRPLLQTENPKKTLEDLFEKRHPIYESTADFVVDTDRYNPKHIVKIIIENMPK